MNSLGHAGRSLTDVQSHPQLECGLILPWACKTQPGTCRPSLADVGPACHMRGTPRDMLAACESGGTTGFKIDV